MSGDAGLGVRRWSRESVRKHGANRVEVILQGNPLGRYGLLQKQAAKSAVKRTKDSVTTCPDWVECPYALVAQW